MNKKLLALALLIGYTSSSFGSNDRCTLIVDEQLMSTFDLVQKFELNQVLNRHGFILTENKNQANYMVQVNEKQKDFQIVRGLDGMIMSPLYNKHEGSISMHVKSNREQFKEIPYFIKEYNFRLRFFGRDLVEVNKALTESSLDLLIETIEDSPICRNK